MRKKILIISRDENTSGPLKLKFKRDYIVEITDDCSNACNEYHAVIVDLSNLETEEERERLFSIPGKIDVKTIALIYRGEKEDIERAEENKFGMIIRLPDFDFKKISEYLLK